jgi:hypothetical protein
MTDESRNELAVRVPIRVELPDYSGTGNVVGMLRLIRGMR